MARTYEGDSSQASSMLGPWIHYALPGRTRGSSETRRARPAPAERRPRAGSRWWPSISTKKTYSHIPVREGRDSIRVMLTPCRASGFSRSCIAPGRLSADITSEVLSRPDGGTSMMADHDEARGVVGIVLDVLGQQVELVQRRRRAAGHGSGAFLLARLARSLGVAHHRHALGARQVLVEPFVALAPGSGCGRRRARWQRRSPARLIRHWCTGSSTSPQILRGGGKQQIERASHRAVGAVFHRHDAEGRPGAPRPGGTPRRSRRTARRAPMPPKCLTAASSLKVPRGPRNATDHATPRARGRPR